MAIDTPAALGSVSISGKSYDIFGSQNRAIEYHGGGVTGEGFTSLQFTQQQRVLVSAYRWLIRQNWKSGFPVPSSGLVPLNIEFAQYELSLLLAEDPEAANARSTGSNERVLQAGPARIEFFSRTDGGSSPFSGEGVFPPQVSDLLKDYLTSRATVITPVASGTGNQSQVLGVDEYGLNEPF